MSRVKKFAHSLASGYVVLVANILFTLAQWPLALRYLSREEFGLWTVVASLAVNLQLLIDLGMSGSVSRILIDHKDDRNSPAYGTIIKTGALAMLVQGALIAVVGGVLSLGLPGWMNIPHDFWPVFRWLMVGHCVLFGAAFAGRIGGFILQAHQRYDVANYAQIGGFALNLIVLWMGFEMGFGLYSLLVGTAANLIFITIVWLIAAGQLGLFPAADKWGRADWRTFREIFSYANEIFLISVGQVLVAMSQTPLITLLLGLEATAVWSTMTKIFMLAQQLIARVFDFSSTPFAEMIVRGERDRLRARFRDVVLLTGSLGVAVCLGVALGNASFVHLWMHGQFSWPVANDLLMALFIVANTSIRCHIGLAGLTKQIGTMKYIYLVEGAVFIALGFTLAAPLGLSGIIIAGIVSSMLCSGLYGLWRSTNYFHTSAKDVLLDWLKLPARLFALLLAVAVTLWFCLHKLPALLELGLEGVGYGVIAAFCFWRFGLPEHLKSEFVARLGRLRVRF